MKTDKVIFDAKVSERKILEVPIGSIVAAPYNPKERTADGQKLRQLTKTVIKYGIIQPLVITSDRDLVDGHRRLAAAKAAGLKTVDCIILPPSVDKDEVFGDLNTSSEKIGGKGWIAAYRYGLRKLPDAEFARCQELHKMLGNYGLDKLIAKKIGTNILPFCRSIKAEGVTMRIEDLILAVVERKLVNKLNAIKRSSASPEEKLAQMQSLLEAA